MMDMHEELDRQAERASLFTHSALGDSFARLGEAQTLLHGLADVLLAKGVVREEELTAAVEAVRDELRERGELAGPGVMIRVDQSPAADAAPVEIDCKARLPFCKAACCRLDFALTIEEVESGRVKWDLGRPYFIRHGTDGRCAHHDSASGGCAIYSDRPGVCRRYNCATDTRIWKDFERMEANTEWIDANLTALSRPRVTRAAMHPAPPVLLRETSS